jgi:hypothetical protein
VARTLEPEGTLLEVRLEQLPRRRKHGRSDDRNRVRESDSEGDEQRLPAPARRSGEMTFVGAREMPGDR